MSALVAQGHLRAAHRTRVLLAGGVAAAPLFLGTVLAQAAVRDGFDLARHPLSLLALGPLGLGVQVGAFVLTGALVTGSAVGLARVLCGQPSGIWGPRLIALYGLGLLWGGLFSADPSAGFPAGLPATETWHGTRHAVAPTVSGLALDVACLVFARNAGLPLASARWRADLDVGLAGDRRCPAPRLASRSCGCR